MGFYFCFFVAVVVVVILFMDPHIPLLNELQYFSALKREVQGRREWFHSLMMQRLEPVLEGPSDT